MSVFSADLEGRQNNKFTSSYVRWPISRAIMYQMLTNEVVALSQHIWESGCGVGLVVVASIRAQWSSFGAGFGTAWQDDLAKDE